MSTRILCILAVAMALAGAVALAPRVAERPTTPTPAAFIDLRAIFSGDENEPDENEVGDQAAARQPAQGRARISILGVVLSAAAGAIAALFVASRLRRLRDRLRSWGVRRGFTADRRH
jgi:hypothetical protein